MNIEIGELRFQKVGVSPKALVPFICAYLYTYKQYIKNIYMLPNKDDTMGSKIL